MAKKVIRCKKCGTEMFKTSKFCPGCGLKNKKSLLKKWWFWLIVLVFISPFTSVEESESKAISNSASVQIEQVAESNSAVERLESEIFAEDPTQEEPTEIIKDTPVDITVDTPVEVSMEEPSEVPVEKPIVSSVEEPVEEAVEKPIELPAQVEVVEPKEEYIAPPVEKPLMSAQKTTPSKSEIDEDQGPTIYITKTGKRYHYDSTCGNGKYFPSTLAQAKSRGLTPCQKCVG